MPVINDEKTSSTDEIFIQIGEFGKYQALIFIFVGCTAFVASITSYSFVFIGATPDFRY